MKKTLTKLTDIKSGTVSTFSMTTPGKEDAKDSQNSKSGESKPPAAKTRCGRGKCILHAWPYTSPVQQFWGYGQTGMASISTPSYASSGKAFVQRVG